MRTYLIERNIPDAKDLTPEDLREISRTSNGVVETLGVPYNWQRSFVAGDKIYCLHDAESAEDVREHARRGGFPADVVSEVAAVFDASTANA